MYVAENLRHQAVSQSTIYLNHQAVYTIIKLPLEPILSKHDEYLLVHAIICRKSLCEIRKKLNKVMHWGYRIYIKASYTLRQN